MLTEKTFTTRIGQNDLVFSTGKFAGQAGGAVTLRVGDSLLLATATMSRTIREGLDFFPLSVDFEEKLYAAGRIPGSFFRREGRPSTAAILTGRLTDRPLRPLFPEGMRNEVQVIISALSSDSIHHLDIMSVNVASAALMISDIPWDGPVGAVRVGYIDGQFVTDPTIEAMDDSLLDLRVAGTRDAIIMVEAGAKEVSESLMVQALEYAHRAIQPLIDIQLEMQATLGKPKTSITLYKGTSPLTESVSAEIRGQLHTIVTENVARDARNEAVAEYADEVVQSLSEEDEQIEPDVVRTVVQSELKRVLRDRILFEGVRPDGRDNTTIRPLACDVRLSPRAHGSGLFQRGETQVLSIVTLGMPREAQKLDGLYPEDSRRFIHHYNFPPFSTGETWPLRGPRRREIGHGALVETALLPMIPDESVFPYTIRVVSEVLSSNGSTSQASVCASSLALMDCGVPIKRPVAGVAMGLIMDEATGKYAILSDIQGAEDHFGDMDFKVAGTSEGITALQMDIKISGISTALMAEALEQARAGRLHILKAMQATLPAPRAQLSDYAPRMLTLKIDPEKIGAVIGKGGSTVRAIQEDFGVSVDIQEDGTVFVASVEGVVGPRGGADDAVALIDRLTREVELGTIFTGKVTRITDFGCFAELLPGVEGMVHISQLAPNRINKVEDIVQLGDEIMVMVTGVDGDSGKIRLSRKAVLEGWTLEQAVADDRGSSRGPSGGRPDSRRSQPRPRR